MHCQWRRGYTDGLIPRGSTKTLMREPEQWMFAGEPLSSPCSPPPSPSFSSSSDRSLTMETVPRTPRCLSLKSPTSSCPWELFSSPSVDILPSRPSNTIWSSPRSSPSLSCSLSLVSIQIFVTYWNLIFPSDGMHVHPRRHHGLPRLRRLPPWLDHPVHPDRLDPTGHQHPHHRPLHPHPHHRLQSVDARSRRTAQSSPKVRHSTCSHPYRNHDRCRLRRRVSSHFRSSSRSGRRIHSDAYFGHPSVSLLSLSGCLQKERRSNWKARNGTGRLERRFCIQRPKDIGTLHRNHG